MSSAMRRSWASGTPTPHNAPNDTPGCANDSRNDSSKKKSILVPPRQAMRDAPFALQVINAKAGSAEPASRPAVETHRRDVATLNAIVAIVVNLMLAAAYAGRIVFILAPPP